MLLVVVGAQDRTTTAQGHVVKRVGSVEGSEGGVTGLVPGLAYQLSSTIVGSERVVVVVEWGNGPDLSDDEVMVEDVESECEDSKRWWWSRQGCWQRRRMPVVGMIEVDGGKNLILSLDEIEVVVVVVGVESRWQRLMALAVVDVGGGGGEKRRWTCIDVVEGGCESVVVIEVDAVGAIGDGDSREEEVMVTDVLGVLWVLVDGDLDETALAIVRGHLKKKKGRRWMLLMVLLIVVGSRDAPRR